MSDHETPPQPPALPEPAPRSGQGPVPGQAPGGAAVTGPARSDDPSDALAGAPAAVGPSGGSVGYPASAPSAPSAPGQIPTMSPESGPPVPPGHSASLPPGYAPPVPPALGHEPPAWSAPPSRGRSGLTMVGVLVLMVLAALGGGVAGAAIYAQNQPDGFGGAGGVRVVDAPQLDYTSLASIASEVGPSVVSVRIGQFGGSGVVMSEDGYILTNAHVVAAAGDHQVRVRFSNGTVADATVVGSDPRSDIAVIRARGVDGLVPAQFGDSDQVLVGDTVLAIGSPLGYEGSVTQGIISAVDRTLRPERPGAPTLSGLLQTDAAINRGNSGGALVNLDGEVVGINTAIAVESQDDGFLGLGFAVPSSRAIEVGERLIAGEEVQHAYLGVMVSPADHGGAVIGMVTPGSPAAEAGLREGDVVIRLGDRQITDANDLVSAVQAAAPGDTLEVEFRRGQIVRSTEITLVEATD